MLRIALVLMLAFGSSAMAYDRGEVLLETHEQIPNIQPSTFNLWEYSSAWHYALPSVWQLTAKAVYFTGPGHFIMPAPNLVVFHTNQTVSFWDGVVRSFLDPGKGYVDIFSDDAELSEIVPMRSGHFLVAERWNDRTRGARVIEFDLQGRVADHRFPELLDADGRALGARHIELLADQCTLLYTLGDDDPSGNRIRRMNICGDTAETDFASLLQGQYAGAIRQMADGTIIVANGSAILRLTVDGSLLRTYEFPGVTHVALTNDGTAFWAAGVSLEKSELRYFGDGTEIPLGNPGSTSLDVPLDVSDLVVVGEWRTALTAVHPRTRAVR